ncbi:hypothetical protein TNCV_560941 [Trichonephila clavipes]|nr:hypothetical protein TNCV_560941 [Trichonephila clavipes]
MQRTTVNVGLSLSVALSTIQMTDCVYVPPLPAHLPDTRHRIEATVARIASDTLDKIWDEIDLMCAV